MPAYRKGESEDLREKTESEVQRQIKTKDCEDSTFKTRQHLRGSLLVHSSVVFILYRVSGSLRI
ncbi:hypothetical protein HanIR_Chr13g0623941 [Helianthus annuus]|nr:hypothetical protein HanIR_Chr13g0623941 [Helianthus annuus]